ncbi:uncharacterized protein EI97DRAFT_498356 [Westerdykella ornata]|uniref:Histone transcription regulator 3 homolog n=1 Tax=Westerdykella ornata TaxID=318751 RepID=A0A6A6JW93_WESOR|nr:uncharacterized protein EI97DRAFT_498356 [Westerdykella ornata]KAF2280088.1 hypothetical protein EI97DRAFT_498356 [Westerdykella ornata]
MRSGFKALNADSDYDSEEEVDDTKEIQVEEALKLYQTALKYHSEGPASFEKAAEAYKELFASDIFKYPESLSEYKRHELYGDTLVFDSILEDDFESGPVQPAGANEAAPNTLQQILHLAYKNHGQFMVETMQHWIKENGVDAAVHHEGGKHMLGVLTHFSEALDKDEADLDLWLRAASVAALFGSRRITRFCLEAVLDEDDRLLESVLHLPGLEEGFAAQELRELVARLEDNLSFMQAPLSSMARKTFSDTLKKRLNPYPFAPLPSEVAKSQPLGAIKGSPERVMLKPNNWNWASVGGAILNQHQAEQNGFAERAPGAAITVDIPGNANAHVSIALDTEHSPREDINNGEVQDQVPQVESPSAMILTTNNMSTNDGDVWPTQDDEKAPAATTGDGESNAPPDAASGKSRKRSTDSAGLPETAEGGRSRSKRIRARDSVAEGPMGADAPAPDPVKQLEEKLYVFTHADKCLFEIINDGLERLGVSSLGSPQQMRAQLDGSQAGDPKVDNSGRAPCDLYNALQNGLPQFAAIFLNSEPVDLGQISRDAGLNAFLGYAKSSTANACEKPTLTNENLLDFARNVNEGLYSLSELAFAWLEMLLSPGLINGPSGSGEKQSTYIQYRWGEDLKRHLVQVLVHFDDYIYEQMRRRIAKVDSEMLRAQTNSADYSLSAWSTAQVEMTETIFELHLDVHALIKHPNSGVDQSTQVIQQDRLNRWTTLARDAMQLCTSCSRETGFDRLVLRHIWASAFQMSVDDTNRPEYILHVMQELRGIFQSAGEPVIEVPNNAIMPELSVDAVDGELARISMKDFFLKIFDREEKDPVAVIESLEPILEPVRDAGMDGPSSIDADPGSSEINGYVARRQTSQSRAKELTHHSPEQEMRKFVETAGAHVRLSLWQRLREAYEAIDYPPMVVSCYLRSIETLVAEFRDQSFIQSSGPERQIKLLRTLRIIDEVFVRTLQIIKNESTALDCLSCNHIQTSVAALVDILRILAAGNMLEDLVRVGHISGPRFDNYHHTTFASITAKLHDMQLRGWMLQYHLFREGISQNSLMFPAPSEDLFEFLRHVHHATGVRGFCHSAGRLFLRLAKDELLRLEDVIDSNTRDSELSQVLHDLYGLKLFVQPAECLDYHSATEPLDKKTALRLLPFIMSQAEKVNRKDLPKTEMKTSIDKVHGVLGRTKPHDDLSFNRKRLNTYLKSPIIKVSLFDCLRGIADVSTRRVSPEASVPAAVGWFFLMGTIALCKFRSQKRLAPGPTEDLSFAQAFFLQDLEYSVDRWETWYRLAQTNDAQLEECVTWSAEKLNNESNELIRYQRAAIHCYVMAAACVARETDRTPQREAKVSDMYTDFGNRIYASSREPFGMTAFEFRENEQIYYYDTNQNWLYPEVPFVPLSPYGACKLAAALFRRAIKGKPDRWWNHYMLAKCLWKMYCYQPARQSRPTPPRSPSSESRTSLPPPHLSSARETDSTGPSPTASSPIASALDIVEMPHHVLHSPTERDVLNALCNAINTLPEKRERGREPILEPHYKLVSIAHKLVQRKAIDYRRGEQFIRQTSFSQNIPGPEDPDDWERYILAVLKALRNADKSSWHHRMIARTSHVLYEDPSAPMVAYAAKHELTQQMFTKTMTVQVWKPEYERPGRHFVYTTRYTRFFINLLDQTGDKTNLELLAKRVRKKQNDFFNHQELWHEICERYINMLRRLGGGIPEGREEPVFRFVRKKDFETTAPELEKWCQDPSNKHPILDVLRDALEFKRLNNGLDKKDGIDNFIGDAYAFLYETKVPELLPEHWRQQQQWALQYEFMLDRERYEEEKLQAERQEKEKRDREFAKMVRERGEHGGPHLVHSPDASLGHLQADGVSEASEYPSNQPFHLYHPSQLQGGPASKTKEQPGLVFVPAEPQSFGPPGAGENPPEEPHKRRKRRPKMIGIKEILRRAEAATVKVTPTPAAPPPQVPGTPMPIRTPSISHPSVVIPRMSSTQKNTVEQATPSKAHGEGPALPSLSALMTGYMGPSSNQISSEDESELSELDEDEVREMQEEFGDHYHDMHEEEEEDDEGEAGGDQGGDGDDEEEGEGDGEEGDGGDGSGENDDVMMEGDQ